MFSDDSIFRMTSDPEWIKVESKFYRQNPHGRHDSMSDSVREILSQLEQTRQVCWASPISIGREATL